MRKITYYDKSFNFYYNFKLKLLRFVFPLQNFPLNFTIPNPNHNIFFLKKLMLLELELKRYLKTFKKRKKVGYLIK